MAEIIKRAKEKEIANHEHMELFHRLRQLRRELAEESNIPPFVVFGDKTLHDICQLLPRNDQEFLLVHGVGKSKLEKYGDPFLEEVNDYLSYL